MKKYKQEIIPSVSIPKEWKTKTIAELREITFKKLKELSGKTVVNKHLKIKIEISVSGLKKTTHGSAMYSKKAALVFCLIDLLRNAEYNNWGDRKDKDAAVIIGYLNFKAKCFIDNKPENIHLVVQVQNTGKFHYTLEVNKKKKIGTAKEP
jgi:hypothetical protein